MSPETYIKMKEIADNFLILMFHLWTMDQVGTLYSKFIPGSPEDKTMKEAINYLFGKGYTEEAGGFVYITPKGFDRADAIIKRSVMNGKGVPLAKIYREG